MSNFGIKIELSNPEAFLLVKETLSRMGVTSNKTKTLYQSAHILHKRNEYYIVHFKEMFEIDLKSTTISEEDYGRRNLIAKLLQDWGMIKVLEVEKLKSLAPLSSVKILSFKEKQEWTMVSKYTIGNKSK